MKQPKKFKLQTLLEELAKQAPSQRNEVLTDIENEDIERERNIEQSTERDNVEKKFDGDKKRFQRGKMKIKMRKKMEMIKKVIKEKKRKASMKRKREINKEVEEKKGIFEKENQEEGEEKRNDDDVDDDLLIHELRKKIQQDLVKTFTIDKFQVQMFIDNPIDLTGNFIVKYIIDKNFDVLDFEV